MAIEVALIPEPTDEAATLINELESELATLYSDDQRHGLAVKAIFQPNIRFFVARKDGVPVGCGGVALFSDFAEVKRMYVREGLRGQGIADAIMERLIAETRTAGHSLLRLETGIHSQPAIRFYERSGFAVCDMYEPYASLPPHTIVASYFMEKRLA